jgi:two-component system, NarL family, nitrate/nitrite response regulator NarL
MAGDAPRAPIRLLIVIDVRLYREGLAATLADHKHLFVAGTVGCYAEALPAVVNLKPDVVIIDVALADSLNLMRELRAKTPTTRIVAFAVDEDISAILDCAEAGAAGFVTANASVDELVNAIDRTIAGELLCSPRMAAELLRRAADREDRHAQPQRAPAGLTSRENQVLVFVRKGLSNKEIAVALNIAESTVKNHVHHLLEKLHVPTRTHAAAQVSATPVRASLRPRSMSSRQAG